MNLTDLRKLAEAATGTEPWIQEFVDVRCVEGGLICATRAVSDARYIAALPPSVVLAMLDVIEAAKDFCDLLQELQMAGEVAELRAAFLSATTKYVKMFGQQPDLSANMTSIVWADGLGKEKIGEEVAFRTKHVYSTES